MTFFRNRRSSHSNRIHCTRRESVDSPSVAEYPFAGRVSGERSMILTGLLLMGAKSTHNWDVASPSHLQIASVSPTSNASIRSIAEHWAAVFPSPISPGLNSVGWCWAGTQLHRHGLGEYRLIVRFDAAPVPA